MGVVFCFFFKVKKVKVKKVKVKRVKVKKVKVTLSLVCDLFLGRRRKMKTQTHTTTCKIHLDAGRLIENIRHKRKHNEHTSRFRGAGAKLENRNMKTQTRVPKYSLMMRYVRIEVCL